jgi:hypothetical protein
MDRHLLQELQDNVTVDVPGFLDAFFPPSPAVGDLFAKATQPGSGLYSEQHRQWIGWPSGAAEKDIGCWFRDAVDNKLLKIYAGIVASSGRQVYRYVLSSNMTVTDGDRKRKPDIVVSAAAPVNTTSADIDFAMLRGPHSWGSIRVVGELKSNSILSNKDKTIVQLADYVSEIFGAQPSRRWVHAFTLCGAQLRAWIFDRSGTTGSVLIDVHREPTMFLRVICGYAAMDATELGFDPTIKCKYTTDSVESIFDPTAASQRNQNPTLYMYIPSEQADDAVTKLILSPVNIFRQVTIVSRGTVCWKAKRCTDGDTDNLDSGWEYVVKDQWRDVNRSAEGSLLPPADTTTFGLPQYVWHDDLKDHSGALIDIAAFVRKGLSVSNTSADQERPISGNNSQKYTSTTKLSSSSNSQKRISVGASLARFTTHLENRILTRLVMSPIGRPIYQYTSYTQLLATLRDAIKGMYPSPFPRAANTPGHRNLFQIHQVLHRDVSVSNILINTDPTRAEAGILIDLDRAIHRARIATSSAKQRTGTPDFMAVGVLYGMPHTYRHDLESFFFVLLWICTYYTGSECRRRSSPPADTLFDACYSEHDEPAGTAEKKLGFVDKPGTFERWVIARMEEDIRNVFAPVLRRWRDLLFPLGYDPEDIAAEEIEGDGEEMYGNVLAVLEEGIEALGRE